MILYTNHAKERIARRLIKKAWVQEVITKPDKVFEVKFGRKQASKKINGAEVSVIYLKEGNNFIVITVFWGQ